MDIETVVIAGGALIVIGWAIHKIGSADEPPSRGVPEALDPLPSIKRAGLEEPRSAPFVSLESANKLRSLPQAESAVAQSAALAYDSGRLNEAIASIPNTSGRSATERQAEALRKLGMVGGLDGLSFEQASAFLSAKAYAEGAIFSIIGRIDDYPGEKLIESMLMAFIVKDEALRARAIAWNKVRFSRRTTHAIPQPKRDEHFHRVRAEAERLLRRHR